MLSGRHSRTAQTLLILPLLCNGTVPQDEPDLELAPWLRWSTPWSLHSAMRQCCMESDKETLNCNCYTFLCSLPTRLCAAG